MSNHSTQTTRVVVDLFGRMGNQLFQYFFGYALSKDQNRKVYYRTTDFRLGHFNFPIKFMTDVSGFSKYTEKGFQHQQIPSKSKLIYRGYWQSEKYFKHYREGILKMFNIPLSRPETVSLHVRRGDYVNLPKHHPTQSIDFYTKAAKMFGNREILVFSDDIPWCIKNLPSNWMFISDQSDVEDFKMMASCRNHVISNSSFSWWAAWLNGEKVVAPKKWLGIAYRGWDTSDLLPPDWEIV